MTTITTITRQFTHAVVALLVALALVLALPTFAAAHGCGTSDHWSGGPHYYEGQVIIRNSRYTRWYEVNFGSGGYNYTWCGCVNPYEPCVK